MSTTPIRLVIVMEGGVVTAAVTDTIERLPPLDLAVIEYDPDDLSHYEASELVHITQRDGDKAPATVCYPWIEPAKINLEEVFAHDD